ncbi:ankyrin repeat and MYND domain-containing protein 2-like [Glandiceps talaboti]
MAPKKGDLTDLEKQLVDDISTGSFDKVKDILSKGSVRVDCLDDHGMTPLQHAAFKGSRELCELFLAHGANVNNLEHENGYTTLMFAALAGSVECCKLLLDAGAKTTGTNSVGRTATQMAAFVGQHACVSVINNYFSKQEVDYYTKVQGFEKEPKLAPHLAAPLHKLVLFSNLNPVKVALYIEKHKELLDNASRVAKVLDIMAEKQFKQHDVNEVLSIKMHYFATIVRACHVWNVEKPEGINGFIKSQLRGKEPDGFQLAMEKVIRESLREYPYHESQLLQQLVRSIAPVKPGEEPSALSILSQGINGNQSFSYENMCGTCGDQNAEKKCSACKVMKYCDQNCQKLHWFTHKKVCKNLAEQYKMQQAMEEMMKKKEEEEKLAKEMEEKASLEKGDAPDKKDESDETQGDEAEKTAKENEEEETDKDESEKKEAATEEESSKESDTTNDENNRTIDKETTEIQPDS